VTAGVVHRFSPRGACAELWRRRDAEVLVGGPAGTGKSRSCLEKVHLAALKYPGMRALLLRKTMASLSAGALVTWRRFVIPEALAAGVVGFYGGSAEEPAQYRYANGSRVVLGGMDKASKVMSTEYDLIYVQEATELVEDDWEALTTRLRYGRMPYQQLLADCNPDTPTHWLKGRCDREATVLLHSKHTDNPLLYDADGAETETGRVYLAKLKALTGVRYQRLFLGRWVAAEGVIYEHFDPAVHVIEPFAIPSDWTRWWTVDFGYTNPFVFQWWAEDGDGKLYLYRELYRTRRTVDQHAADVATFAKSEPRARAVLCDHDAEGRATLENELEIGTDAADKRVLEGIDAVQTRLRDRRLFLFEGCRVYRDPELDEAHKPTCTAEELPGYVWADYRTKEGPVKENDHGADALRYMVAARDLGGRPRVRFMDTAVRSR
jgi:PBSX family phage terminase large subunit